MMVRRDAGKWLRKKAKVGARRFPVGTIAFYGPDNMRASKVVAAIYMAEGEEAADLRRWTGDAHDVRQDAEVLGEISAFLKANGVRSVGMIDRIIGCPHEEGIDYPTGDACPTCPFWAGRDRWTGQLTSLTFGG